MKKNAAILITSAALLLYGSISEGKQKTLSYKGFLPGTDRNAVMETAKKVYRSFSSGETAGAAGEKVISIIPKTGRSGESRIDFTFTPKGRLYRIEARSTMSSSKFNSLENKILKQYGTGTESRVSSSFLDSSLKCRGAGTAGDLFRCRYDRKGRQACSARYGACLSIEYGNRYYIRLIKPNRGEKIITIEDRKIHKEDKKQTMHFDFKEFD